MKGVKALHEVVPAAGVMLVSADGLRVADWRPNAAEEVLRRDFEEPTEDWRDLRGPSAGSPRGASGEGAPGTRSGQQRDLFDRRLEEHRVHFARAAAPEVAVLAGAHGWELVLVLGDPRLTHPAAEALRSEGLSVVERDRQLEWVTPHELAARVAGDLEAARAEAQLALFGHVRDEALTGGRGALGPDDCRTTAGEGRVAVLLVDPSLEGADELAALVSEQRGRVVAAAAGLRAQLGEAGGAVALLRW